MSKIKRYYEDVGYFIGGIIREDLPGWEQWFEEDEEEGSLEDQVVTLLLTCQFDRLLFILRDLSPDGIPQGRVEEVVRQINRYKDSLKQKIDSMILYGNDARR